MALPFVFSGNQKPTLEQLDSDLNALGTSVTILCTGAGTNAITLTPVANQAAVTSYGAPNPVRFGWLAPNNTTGAVTISVAPLAFLPLYLAGGTVQAGNGSIQGGAYYESVYVPSLNSGAGGQVLVSNTPNPAQTIIPGAVGGLALSPDGSLPLTFTDIASGTCVSDDATTYMSIANFSKSTAAWAVGSVQGGLAAADVPVSNNTWYHVWVIARTDTGLVDAFLSTSLTPTLPTNYTKKRRIGSIKTDGAAHILAYTQFGTGNLREYLWTTPPLDFNADTNLTNVQRLYALSVPLGIKTLARVSLLAQNTAATGTFSIYSPDITTARTNLTSQVTSVSGAAEFLVRTNTSSQVALNSGQAANNTISLATMGWMDSI